MMEHMTQEQQTDELREACAHARFAGYEAAIDEIIRWSEIHYRGKIEEVAVIGPLVRHMRRCAAERGPKR